MTEQERQAVLEEGERLDDIGFGGLWLIQKPGEFCYGIDAVLLADFASAGKAGKIADLGTGTGIIPLILSHKTESEEIWGIEIQKDSWSRAVRAAKLNQLEDRLHFVCCDVKEAAEQLTAGSFDVVVSNPPYTRAVCGMQSENRAKMIARHETTAGLEDFILAASRLLRKGGSFFLIHRPERIPDICWHCRNCGMETKEMRLVSTNRDVKPSMVLVRCVKGGGNELRFRNPLYIYRQNGSYTSEIQRIYERNREKNQSG